MSHCPFCGRPSEDMFYVRWFSTSLRQFEHCVTAEITPSKRKYPHGMVFVNGGDRDGVLIVNLSTGSVIRNDFKRPVPRWIEEPVVRAAIAAGAELPPIYKKDKKKVDRRLVTA